MSNKKIFKYDGEKMQIAWDERLCIHVGECTRAEGDLFVSGRDPWADPDCVEADYVAEVVRRCPTGALTCKQENGGPVKAISDRNVATLANNGPLYLEGDLRIDGAADDMEGVRSRAALCRCGDSKNKPFCDNTHENKNFCDRGALGSKGSETQESTGGPLKITRVANGPLLLNGNFVIRTAAGREGWRGSKAALCRCGESKNKPFCDGRHKDAGFVAE